jgi:MATE family multidrug resistance protein
MSGWRAELRATISLALPIIVTQLAQIAILTTDVVMMGWLGPEALASGALGVNIIFLLVVTGLGVTMATSPLMAQALGARRHSVREVRRTVRQGFWASALLGLPAMLIAANALPILLALGQEEAIARDAARYAWSMSWGYVPMLCFMVLRQFMAALERPNLALLVQFAMLPINALLVYALTFGRLGAPALGLFGAGIGSSITQALGFLALGIIVVVHRRFRRFHVFGRLWRLDLRRLGEIFRLGTPIALAFLFECSLFAGAVYAIGLLGTIPLAAHQIAIQVAAITFMVPFGLAQAATVRVGLAMGAGDRDGVRRAGWTALALGLGAMAVMAVALLVAREPIVAAFLDASRPGAGDVAKLAVELLVIAALFQIFDGTQAVAMATLRGLKDTRVPMLIAATGYWLLGFPSGCLAAFWLGHGAVGMWWGIVIGLAVVSVWASLRFRARERLGLMAASA